MTTFFSDRTFRLNYFAVKALLARVYVEGSDIHASARQEASDVIREGERLDSTRVTQIGKYRPDSFHGTYYFKYSGIHGSFDGLLSL
ncbi:MAG: hypothetical protein ACLU4N_02870 [Butyricimonas faecihominis]